MAVFPFGNLWCAWPVPTKGHPRKRRAKHSRADESGVTKALRMQIVAGSAAGIFAAARQKSKGFAPRGKIHGWFALSFQYPENCTVKKRVTPFGGWLMSMAFRCFFAAGFHHTPGLYHQNTPADPGGSCQDQVRGHGEMFLW